jgi:hypothetical protein
MERRDVMKQKYLIAALIALAVLFLTMALSRTADAAVPPEDRARQAAPPNRATVDVTINDRGDISLGGIALSALGIAPLDPQVVQIVKNVGNANLQVQDETVTVTLADTEVARLLWDEASRARAAALAGAYGVQLQPEVQQRVEEWISSSDIDLTVRSSPEASRPIVLSLTKPIEVDIAANGQLAVEGGALAAGVDPTVLQTIRMGGSQAVACWNEGTLTASVDGGALPTLVLNPEGVDLLARAFNLPINNHGVEAILSARLGVDLSLPGGTHSGTTCGDEAS